MGFGLRGLFTGIADLATDVYGQRGDEGEHAAADDGLQRPHLPGVVRDGRDGGWLGNVCQSRDGHQFGGARHEHRGRHHAAAGCDRGPGADHMESPVGSGTGERGAAGKGQRRILRDDHLRRQRRIELSGKQSRQA
jgi:hypothetical protein